MLLLLPADTGEDLRGSLRQHYLEQVQRVCDAPAPHSQPSRPAERDAGWLPCIAKTLDRSGGRVKGGKAETLKR